MTNLHVPPEIAKQRQQQMMMQLQAENQLYSVALQIFLRLIDVDSSTRDCGNAAKTSICFAEIFHAAVDEHRKAKHAEQTSPIQVD